VQHKGKDDVRMYKRCASDCVANNARRLKQKKKMNVNINEQLHSTYGWVAANAVQMEAQQMM
jgi:hypothetical protein